MSSIKSTPINILDLNTTSKLAYWIKHLPYFKYYTSNLSATDVTTNPSSIEIKINKSELQLSQQIADIFYENSISGCTIDQFSKNDYNSLKTTIISANDNNNNYIEYIYSLISESQTYYSNSSNNPYNPMANITDTDTDQNQLPNKNWMFDTYKKYVFLIQQILPMIPDIEKNENNISNERKLESDTYPPPPEGELYIKSPTLKWRECSIINTLDNGSKWVIHYKNFHSKFDEIINANDKRLTNIKPQDVIPKRTTSKSNLKYNNLAPENRIWVQSGNNKNIHRECVIINQNNTQYKIHFISYHEKHDMWIHKTSPRIKKTRPLGKVLIKGDNLSCYNNKMQSWLEIEVIKVNNNKKEVKVAWIGTNKLKPTWLKMNDSKLSIIHKKHTATAPAPRNE